MVTWRADGFGGLGAGDWAAVRFTVWQAIVSAAISVICAIPIARALARRSFPGRTLLVTLLGAPFILPVIVGVLGLIAVFGRSGWVNDALGFLGLGAVWWGPLVPGMGPYRAGGLRLGGV
ncbi:MAG: thiamine/thiamine pyrophosphate ABC transporter permease ThiP, partial [Pseudomonadota bacterium]